MSDKAKYLRWRLVLGEDGTSGFGGAGTMGGGSGSGESLPGDWQRRDQLLGFLYDREYEARNVRGGDRSAGMGNSQLTVPSWIHEIHQLFPKQTIERLERDALERYELTQMVTNPEVLARAEPNATLLKAVLQTQHLMNPEVLEVARRMVKQVVEQLMEKLSRPIRSAFGGALQRKPSRLKVARNFDADTSIRRNLAHYDTENKRIVLCTPYFFSRQQQQNSR